jgi:hypothetical protein
MTARRLNSMKRLRDNMLTDIERREFKTWLGLRYDRPAVPIPFEDLAKVILYPTVIGRLPENLKNRIRDVLVLYESVKEVRLIAVLRDEADRNDAEDWLDECAELLYRERSIVVIERHAGSSKRVSLQDIETYYALDSAELSLSNATVDP